MNTARTIYTKSRLVNLRAHRKVTILDALVVTNTPDIRWLTGAKNTFDDEQCHIAFITQDEALLHIDSRYLEALKQNLAYPDAFTLDEKPCLNPLWAAQKIDALAPTLTVAIQNSAPISFLDELEKNLSNERGEQDENGAHDENGAQDEYPTTAKKDKREITHLGADITDLRGVKTPNEIQALQAAQDITDKAILFIQDFIKSGMAEKTIRAALENFMLENGADAISFETIIAAGPSGANPHARPGEYKVQEGDLIVIDFGAAKDDYHADMTRTLAVGQPSQEQLDVYEVVKEAHEKAAAALRPGVIGKDIHEIAANVIKEAGYGKYFGHGLGHGVGIEIHENPNLNARWDKPIPEGAVVTIEPGIYLPQKFGIRLEDTGVVTEEGFKPFTKIGHELITCS